MNKKWLKHLSLGPFTSDHARIMWVAKKIKKIPVGENILDVGAGECRFKAYCSHLKYVSHDFGEYKGGGDNIGLQTGEWDTSKIDIISDIIKIPVEDSSFNNVLCTEVLEHVPYPELAIKEISRILKKGGKLILTAPFSSQTHFSPYFFLTGFSPNWYKKILPEYNLKIVKMEANGDYFRYLSQEVLRLPLFARKYSYFSYFSYLFYVLIFPLAVIFLVISKLSKGSEKQLCFDWHVFAVKK